MADNMCTCKTKKGLPCGNRALANASMCYVHTKLGRGDYMASDIVSEISQDGPDVVANNNVGEPSLDNDMDTDSTSDINTITYHIAAAKAVIAFENAKIKKLMKLLNLHVREDARILTKAKSLFYHEHKKNSNMITDIVSRLQVAGLYTTKITKGKGATEIPAIPYQIIRRYTDDVFDKLDGVSQDKYIETARGLVKPPII